MMTIDEAITREKNRSDSMVKHAEIFCVTQEFLADIEYHGQVAEWLEELKKLRSLLDERLHEKLIYSKVKEDSYNKAINDYMNVLCDQCLDMKNECYQLECPFCSDGCDIVNIAQQLKERGENA